MTTDGLRMMQIAWYGVVPTGPNGADAPFAMYHAICEVTMRCVELNPLRYLLLIANNVLVQHF